MSSDDLNTGRFVHNHKLVLGVERGVSIKRQQIHFHKNEFLDDSIQTLV